MKSFFIKHKVVASILVTAVQFAAVFLIFSFIISSDENHAELSLSGDYFGAYAYQYPFINALWSQFLIVLYRILGMVPWYTVFDLIFLFVSFATIHYSLLTVLLSKNLSLPFIEGIYSFVFCVVLLPNLFSVVFTFVAGLLAASAVSLLFIKLAEKENFKRQRIFSVILIVLSFCVRAQSCYVGLCFYFLTLFVIEQITDNTAKSFQKNIKTFLPLIMIIAVISGSLFALNMADKAIRNTEDGRAVLEWNRHRSRLFDYYDEDRYEQDKDFFASIGYDENLFRLSKHTAILNDNSDANTLSKISEYLDDTIPKNGIRQTIDTFIAAIKENISNRTIVPLLLGSFILFVLLLIRIISKGTNHRYWWLFYIVSTVCGTVILCLYLCQRGRFNYYLFRLCVAPAFLSLLFAWSSLFWKKDEDEKKRSAIAENFTSVLIVLFPILLCYLLKHYFESNIITYSAVVIFAVLVFVCMQYDFRLKLKNVLSSLILCVTILAICLCSCLSVRVMCYNFDQYSEEQPEIKTINSYLNSHSENIYITGRPGHTDIKNYITDSNTLINCFYLFDYMQFSEVYRNKLAINKRDSISFKSLLEDNTYFIVNDKDQRFDWMLGYLSHESGAEVKAEIIETLENDVNVYRFSVS